jgi:hypothetical protein
LAWCSSRERAKDLGLHPVGPLLQFGGHLLPLGVAVAQVDELGHVLDPVRSGE